jgi:23S rRNA (uridine2552-2'-O)-methyltransferase
VTGKRGGAGGGPKGGGLRDRSLTVRVKTAKTRTASSTRWLARQLNDPFVAEARRLGYRSRAAFKLLQIDAKVPLLRRGARIVDLGCAPGGWTQMAGRRIGREGRIVGIDILPVDPLPNSTTLQMDFLDPAAPVALRAALGGQADLVLSDMAAPTTGHGSTDHIRIVALAEAALDFACDVLAPGGAFVVKLFQGGADKALLDRLKRSFAKVRNVKPAASRSDSAETYVVATGFRRDGGAEDRADMP